MAIYNVNGIEIHTDRDNITTNGKNYNIGFDTVQCIGHASNDMKRLVDLYNKGIRFCEVDICFTKDNIPVGSHDDDITNRIVNNDGTPVSKKVLLSETTFSELSKYKFKNYADSEVHYMNIEDLLYYCRKKNMCVIFDIKYGAVDIHQDVLYDMVLKADMIDSVAWCSAGVNYAYMSNKNESLIYDVIGSISAGANYKKSALIILDSSNIDSYTKENITNIHKEGFKCYAWTVDNKETLKHLFDNGIDFVCTNIGTNDDI